MSMLAIPVIFAALCWLLSLRRTPFAIGWLAISAVAGGFGMLIVGSADAVHHTLPGLVAAVTAACVPPAVLALCVESVATASPGTSPSDIAAWRRDRARQRRLPSRDRWSAYSVSSDEGVSIYVRRGARDRLIGSADPLADMDAFMELRAKADQAAETLNALKIDG